MTETIDVPEPPDPEPIEPEPVEPDDDDALPEGDDDEA